jgi:long-chain fatty acid transport protein
VKKNLVLGVLVLCCVSMASAGILTNANQSALYFRLLSRNASTDIDAVYYNPAGLLWLNDGWHLGLYNQTIFKDRTVVNDLTVLNDSEYLGKVRIPFFPNVYAIYKKGRLALSFGFGPNAGGGKAEYSRGLPSFESQISMLPAKLSLMGLPTTKYSTDIAFDGSSVYLGFQLNASYAINDMFAGAFGIRYISATNTYEGHLRDIRINPYMPALGLTGQLVPAPQVFTAIGQPAYAAMTSDKVVDVEQTGSAFTPILSLHVHPAERLNISAKYEFKTGLELTNKTTQDDTGRYIDGAISHSDIPAILSFGVEYGLMPELRVSVSFNYSFDKDANWDGRENLVDSNTYDLGFGIEYDVTRSVAVSAGYLRTKYGLNANYNLDTDFENSSNAFGVGARIRLGQKLDLDLGGFLVNYQDASKTINYGAPFGSYPETYKQTTSGFSFGLGYHF